VFAALVVPSLTVYQTELFPTGNRSGSNGWINLFAVVGAVIGLKAAGLMADAFGSFGPAMAILSIGPAIVVVIVLAFYPETASRELEELNPEDAPPPRGEALAQLDEVFEVEHEHAGRDDQDPVARP